MTTCNSKVYLLFHDVTTEQAGNPIIVLLVLGTFPSSLNKEISNKMDSEELDPDLLLAIELSKQESSIQTPEASSTSQPPTNDRTESQSTQSSQQTDNTPAQLNQSPLSVCSFLFDSFFYHSFFLDSLLRI